VSRLNCVDILQEGGVEVSDLQSFGCISLWINLGSILDCTPGSGKIDSGPTARFREKSVSVKDDSSFHWKSNLDSFASSLITV